LPGTYVNFATNSSLSSSSTSTLTSPTNTQPQAAAPTIPGQQSSALSSTAKVALGIGLGVGFPVLILLLILIFKRNRNPTTLPSSEQSIAYYNQTQKPPNPMSELASEMPELGSNLNYFIELPSNDIRRSRLTSRI
jgi:hypothetical protein